MLNRRTPLRLAQLESRDVPTTLNLFDEAFYMRRYPDVAAAVSDGNLTAEQHFRIAGDKEGRAGNPIFEPSEYQARNGDVASAVAAGRTTVFQHFERFGQFEQRDPSSAFRTADYLVIYDDVRSAVQAGRITPFEHFYLAGVDESRLPFREFSRTDYLEDYPDVKAADFAGQTNAVAHYELYGRHEGRTPHALAPSPMGNPLMLQAGQAIQLAGQSSNQNDRQLYSITPIGSGMLSVSVTFNAKIDVDDEVPRARVENAVNSQQLFQRVSYGDDNNELTLGVGPQWVTGAIPLLLRISGVQGMTPDYTVEVTLA